MKLLVPLVALAVVLCGCAAPTGDEPASTQGAKPIKTGGKTQATPSSTKPAPTDMTK